MFSVIIAAVASIAITPGAVPTVHNIHPDEAAWIQEIKDDRPEPVQIILDHYHAPRPPAPLAPDYIETLIQTYFLEPDWDWARRVSYCESGWDANAKNPYSSASGLFQHLASYWEQRSAWAGWGEADIFDPEANVAVAAWLYYDGGPGHWVCK